MPEETQVGVAEAISRSVSILPDEKQGEAQDIFERDWQIAERYWLRKHKVWDYGYLNYKSVLTFNDLYGKDYLRAFGMRAFVPRTYQTVESIGSQLNGSKTEFVIKGATGPNGFKDKVRAKYFQMMDNTEWKRGRAEKEKREAVKNALLFGNGYLLNVYIDDRETVHVVELPEEKDTEPKAAADEEEATEVRTVNVNDPKSLNWVEKEMTRYRGMKIFSQNPYYIFPDPNAKGDRWRYCYRYVPGTVEELREFVVSKGWLTKEEAFDKIKATGANHYDKVRDTIDTMFEQPITPYTRGDHQSSNVVTQPSFSREENGEFCALIERYEGDYFEVRLGDAKTVIYKDWNIYPHKEIPIIVVKDNPVPDEVCGIGEPELIRWQQVEENRLHNLLMDAVMMTVVQRFAINATLLEDPTDISFHNPFKPIRLKPLPGVSVAQAVMPLPQPEVKQSPFELLRSVKEIAQATSGASDFIVSSNESIADTATESNNLLAATTMRIKDKARFIQEESLPSIVRQWHACFYYFYDEEMDYEIIGEDTFIRWLPFDRGEANNDPAMVKAAQENLDAIGDTLEDVYKNAGYKDVVFLSDVLDGSFNVEIRVTDVEADKQKTLEDFLRVAKVANETNAAAKESGETRRFNTFEIILEALKNITSIDDPGKYVMGAEKLSSKKFGDAMQPPQPGVTPPGAGADALTGVRQGQVTPGAELPDVNEEARATGKIGPVQATNSGINV